ncbi:hypothetical protein PPEP_a0849 [Pseudoalteromonas peptidolytica F12-50-A1]|uniref:Uncharacterized protein n=1 Tax=Pseudoalteromonas peptidolytica F12-50-A1 TaxID=1315280 RepID=A0A8I0MU14_9GAMM|nr:hypothetical protein [Pseudoalteromonas peptidolytica F12-50-A1]
MQQKAVDKKVDHEYYHVCGDEENVCCLMLPLILYRVELMKFKPL